MTTSRNIAGTVGRWSATHRKTAIAGWVVFVIAAFMVGNMTGTQKLTDTQSGVGDSGTAAKVVDKAYPKHIEESVLIQSKRLKAGDPEFKAVVAAVTNGLRETPKVDHITSPYATGPARGPTSEDGHSVLVSFQIPGDYAADAAVLRPTVDRTLDVTAGVAAKYPAFNVEQFGSASSEDAFMEIFNSDLKKAGASSLPLTLFVLLLAFGTMLLAGMPLLLAITGVVATIGLVGPISQIAPVEESIAHVILLIGLAVGVDYSLFYLRRVREERAAGRDRVAAIEAAAATSGRAVLVSGLTVMTAMAGMYLAGAPTFTGWATGTIAVVAVAMIGSLTVLPAMLSAAGDRVIKQGRIPGLRQAKARAAQFGLWSRVTDRVLRRPALSAVLATGLLVAMAIPALHMKTGEPGTETLPKDLPIVQTYNRVTAAFPSETNGMDLVLKARDVTAPEVAQAIQRFEASMRKHPDLFPDANVEMDVSPNREVAIVTFATAGDMTSKSAGRALDKVRDDLVPAAFGDVDGVQTLVSGGTAQVRDFNDVLNGNIALVFAFVLTTAFLLLLVTFRSIVIPVKAILLNLLSVFAAYGLMVLVFQHGWFKGLLGFEHTGPIVQWLPLFMFVILFGLSMDYHVFILSRVREAVDRGMSTSAAVSYAIKNTAGVVTSAALVMVGVFAIFGSLSWMMFKQMGVGLAFAVLLDATLIRGVLLPSTMTLLGERNWWLPKSLRWLPEVGHEPEAPAAGWSAEPVRSRA